MKMKQYSHCLREAVRQYSEYSKLSNRLKQQLHRLKILQTLTFAHFIEDDKKSRHRLRCRFACSILFLDAFVFVIKAVIGAGGVAGFGEPGDFVLVEIQRAEFFAGHFVRIEIQAVLAVSGPAVHFPLPFRFLLLFYYTAECKKIQEIFRKKPRRTRFPS